MTPGYEVVRFSHQDVGRGMLETISKGFRNVKNRFQGKWSFQKRT